MVVEKEIKASGSHQLKKRASVGFCTVVSEVSSFVGNPVVFQFISQSLYSAHYLLYYLYYNLKGGKEGGRKGRREGGSLDIRCDKFYPDIYNSRMYRAGNF